MSAAVHAPLTAMSGFSGTLKNLSSPFAYEPRLLVHALKPIGVRVSPAAVWTTSTGAAELKSNETALSPRSFSEKSNHLPDTVGAELDDDTPFGNLTVRPASRLSSCFRAVVFSGNLLSFIAGRSLSHTRFITFCMSRTPLVIATTVSSSGITIQYWPNAPSPRKGLWRERQNGHPYRWSQSLVGAEPFAVC